MIILLILLFSVNNIYSNEKIPVENYYDTKELFPLEMKLQDWKFFSKTYKSLTSQKPIQTYRHKDVAVALIPKKYKELISKNLDSKDFIFKTYPPFRYYEVGYRERYKQGYTSLKDLLSGYKDYKLNEIYLKGIAKAFPSLVTYHEIGKTHGGRSIPAVQITKDNLMEEKPSVLFNCAHHANELISTEHCYHIIYSLLSKQKKYSSFLNQLVIWIVPIVNPDGSYLFWYKSIAMGRKNGFLFDDQSPDDLNRGVDINRNYPFKWNSGHSSASSDKRNHPFYRGPYPASEPETQAMISLFETERFLLSMSFHAFATKILFPYSIENTTNPKPDIPKEIAQRILKNVVSYHPTKDFQVVKNIYPVDGTDQDYFYYKYGTIALLTESSHKNISYEYIPTIMEGFAPAWENFLNEYIEGYKLILKITNEEDEPVTCKIKINEFEYYEGEEFTNNPKTGFYHKIFLNSDEYTLQLNCEGYENQSLKFRPQKDFFVREIVLKKNDFNQTKSSF